MSRLTAINARVDRLAAKVLRNRPDSLPRVESMTYAELLNEMTLLRAQIPHGEQTELAQEIDEILSTSEHLLKL